MNSEMTRRAGAALAAAVVTMLAGGAPVAVAAVGGDAYALSANVNALAAPLSVGALPSVTLPADGGGPYVASLLSANIAGLAPVRAATVSTQGNTGLGTAASSASVLEAGVAGLVTVAAARSRCTAARDGAAGSADVADLVVAGIPISTLDAGPNTRIALPVGSVIVNEQLRSGDGRLTVNAVHVSLEAALVSGEIVIGHSRCSATTSARTRGLALHHARAPRRS